MSQFPLVIGEVGFVLGLPLVVQRNSCVGHALIVMEVKIIDVFVCQVEHFFDWLARALNHPVVVRPDLLIIGSLRFSFSDHGAAIGANIIINVVVVIYHDCDRLGTAWKCIKVQVITDSILIAHVERRAGWATGQKGTRLLLGDPRALARRVKTE